ncbi:hypothetical protein EDB92DRAFT_1954302 [Lactarius akahatsu]|uniref:Homeobox domain-containing protein n=1 Tax=Lactarius akahatsu TaxID=416441 RepID=A0AAD4Q354_9AGAM|nr:hypothetical protein EDB92DRAFT_1954302 [Lactarius akahatsu]
MARVTRRTQRWTLPDPVALQAPRIPDRRKEAQRERPTSRPTTTRKEEENTHTHDPASVCRAARTPRSVPISYDGYAGGGGRSIGLSARKVQVWFQNQRQKARRPRNQGSDPLTRPPQYGAFPTCSRWYTPSGGPSSFPLGEGQSPFYMAPPAPFIRFNAGQGSPSRKTLSGRRLQVREPVRLDIYLVLASLDPAPHWLHDSRRHRPPVNIPIRGSPRTTANPCAPTGPPAVMPSREFTFSLPFPPLHVPETSPGAHFSQTRFPPPPPLSHHPVAASPQHMSLPAGGEPALPPPPTTFRGRVTPAHARPVPGACSQPRSCAAAPHTPAARPRDAARAFASSSTPRAAFPAAPCGARCHVGLVARWQPAGAVREAASERSGSQGTDVSTPPRPGTPHA